MSEFNFTTRDGAVIRGLDEGAGPVLLCISGLGGTASFWDPCVDGLRRGWRLLRLDQRGIGASTRGEAACSVEQLADDCLALLDFRGIDSCIVTGHSTGGCIAQAMAVAAPGHTPGHTAFALQSGAGRMMVMSDTTNHPALFVRNPDWMAIFDMDGEQARQTRRKLLDMAASEKAQVAFYHAPFPATGYIAKDGDKFRLAPVQWSAQL